MNQAEFDRAVVGLPLTKQAFFLTIGSTNDVVAEWAKDGVRGLAVAAADEQTQGRGRAGRRWLSPAGSALAFSLLLDLQPEMLAEFLGRASGLGALAVCQALETLYELGPQIKWPNDVLLNGKKVCGVLPEAHWTGSQLQALILGIGINIAPSSVPPAESLNFPATCVEAALDGPAEAGPLLRSIIEAIVAWKGQLGSPALIEAWESRLAYKDDEVRLEHGAGGAVEAQLVGLDEGGSLRLRLEDGKLRSFQMGEIQIRPVTK